MGHIGKADWDSTLLKVLIMWSGLLWVVVVIAIVEMVVMTCM
jgi:hypothetical protein